MGFMEDLKSAALQFFVGQLPTNKNKTMEKQLPTQRCMFF
jgi:hypothetical protein